MIRVCVVGAAGRMGSETVRAIANADDVELVQAIDNSAEGQAILGVTVEGVFPYPLKNFDVIVEFTHAESATDHAVKAAESGISPVIGASGLDANQQERVSAACRASGIGGILVPNFAIGAVLMMRFASEAAKWLPNVEVIEMHHDKKQDAPSGTAIRTAELISQARTTARNNDPTQVMKYTGARGSLVADVPVHSVRLPGLVAHQLVVFGGEGELLSLRHDSMNRTSFMPGVLLAIRKVRSLSGFVVGLDAVMD